VPTNGFTPQKGETVGNILLACTGILFFVGINIFSVRQMQLMMMMMMIIII
jgi:hypothetical protein